MGVNFITSIIVVTFICIFWFWYMLANPPIMMHKPFNQLQFKTGDLILFHAYDNINPVMIGSYWGHVGIVYKDIETGSRPLLFEAARTSKMKNCPEHNKHGIMITDLQKRLEKYPGKIACKILQNPVNNSSILEFKELMNYAKKNMYYNEDIFYNGIKKKKGQKLNNATNCGELVLLSLVKLGLLKEDVLDTKIAHHLLYVVKLNEVENNKYLNPIEITFNPF